MALSVRPTTFGEQSQSLAEYQTDRGGSEAHLSFFNVRESMHQVSVRTPHLTYYGIVEGTMRVQSDDEDVQSLGGGDSLVVPPLQTLTLDFPDAGRAAVQYVVLKIDSEEVQRIFGQIDDGPPDETVARGWQVEEQSFSRVDAREGIERVLNMVAYLFREDPPNRDRLIDLNAMELIIQMLQTPSRPLMMGEFSRNTASGGLAAAVQYIQGNLDRHISIDELVDVACMSKSSFYRHFSDEFEMSPLEYITQERVVRARELLSDPENTVTSVSHTLGFSSTSHFINMFKEHEGVTPKQYQLDVNESRDSVS
jgi:AraC-like DNA-binding protein/uncharacterized cupin superfamily protein